MIRGVIRAVLPGSAMKVLRHARGWARLRSVAQLQFDTRPLARLSEINTESAFRDQRITSDWNADAARIIALFGNEDLLDGVNPGDRRALYSLVRAAKPRNVLEVGTHIGASTLFIALALEANNNGGRVTTVDVADVNDADRGAWRRIGMRMSPRAYAEQLNCAHRIQFVTRDSVQFLTTTDEQFDFIFLDGDHSADTVYREVAASLKRLQPSGCVLLHDFYPDAQPLFPDDVIVPGPALACARIVREGAPLVVKPLGNLPWPTKQGTSATSLALIAQSESGTSGLSTRTT